MNNKEKEVGGPKKIFTSCTCYFRAFGKKETSENCIEEVNSIQPWYMWKSHDNVVDKIRDINHV